MSALYFRGLTGRWLALPRGDRTDRRLDAHTLARAATLSERVPFDARPVCECEVCGDVVVLADQTHHYGSRIAPDRWSWTATTAAALPETAGDHRHDGDLVTGIVRWYRLRAIGPWKDERTGSVAELVAQLPPLIRGAWPVPTIDVVNDVLADGRVDAPRAGGLEFPPMQLAEPDWPAVWANLVAVRPGLVDTPVPEAVRTVAEFELWWQGVLASFSPGARAHMTQLLLEAGTGMSRLTPDSPQWHVAIDRYQRLQANVLLVLETHDAG